MSDFGGSGTLTFFDFPRDSDLLLFSLDAVRTWDLGRWRFGMATDSFPTLDVCEVDETMVFVVV